MNQRETVLDHIKTRGSITAMDAYKRYGITQLGTRIFELKEQGHDIRTRPVEGGNWVEYYIHYPEQGALL